MAFKEIVETTQKHQMSQNHRKPPSSLEYFLDGWPILYKNPLIFIYDKTRKKSPLYRILLKTNQYVQKNSFNNDRFIETICKVTFGHSWSHSASGFFDNKELNALRYIKSPTEEMIFAKNISQDNTRITVDFSDERILSEMKNFGFEFDPTCEISCAKRNLTYSHVSQQARHHQVLCHIIHERLAHNQPYQALVLTKHCLEANKTFLADIAQHLDSNAAITLLLLSDQL